VESLGCRAVVLDVVTCPAGPELVAPCRQLPRRGL
jgi:hypothetical protein